MGVKFGIWRVPSSTPNFTPSVQRLEPPKLKFLLRFDQNVEYKRPVGAYPWRDLHKICSVCTSFQDALGVKILLDLLKGLWSYGCFKLRGSGCHPSFLPLANAQRDGRRAEYRWHPLFNAAKFG